MKALRFARLLVVLLIPLLVACGGPPAQSVGNGQASALASSASRTALLFPPPRSADEAATSAVDPPANTTTADNASSETPAASASSIGSATETATAGSGGQAASSSNTTDEPAPPEQQVLRISWGEPLSLDPTQVASANDATIVQQLFTGLTRLDSNLRPQPAIADSWKFNDDSTQVTFTLKETQWSDGKPVTAQDFVYAARRVVDPRIGGTHESLTPNGIIKGVAAVSSTPVSDTARLQQALDNLGVKALDARTLQVTLEHPAPYFPSVATGMIPLREDVVEQYGDTWTEPGHLVGDGPFVLKSWTKGAEMTLARNPQYYAGAPRLTALIFKFISDQATAFANYQSGELDSSSVPPPEIPAVRNDPQFKDQLVDIPQLGTFMYGWNTNRPPFDNVKVRQAFAAAIDRQAIVQDVLHGVGTPAYSFIPPGMPGHLSAEEAGAAAQVYDPAKAKELLAEAGYPNGQGFPEIKLTYPGPGPFALVSEHAQTDLQNNLGINIALDPRQGGSAYFKEITENEPQFYFIGWRADFPDPSDFDVAEFGPGKISWQNESFTRLIYQADKETDPNKRIDTYKQAEKILAQDAPRIFVYWFGTFRLYKPYVKRLSYTSQDILPGQNFFKDVYIVKH